MKNFSLTILTTLFITCLMGQDKITSYLEIVNIETKEREIVYTDSQLIEAPNWSMNDYLYINSGGLLYKVKIGEQEKHLINTGSAKHLNNDHGISPDGTKLVISSHDPLPGNPEAWKTSKIYILPIEGGEARLVTKNGLSFWHGWSPDGNILTYTANRNNQWDIYTISVDGGVETQLTNTPAHDDGSEYSHDGKFIYYNSYVSGSMEIWRMNADGSNQTGITNDAHSNWFPHPSPDGKYIVYLCFMNDHKEGHPFGQDVKLKLIDLATGNIFDLTEVFYGGQGTINVPSWSPDSKKVAFMRYAK